MITVIWGKRKESSSVWVNVAVLSFLHNHAAWIHNSYADSLIYVSTLFVKWISVHPTLSRPTFTPPLPFPVWCYPVCCIITKYSPPPPPHQENKRKSSYDRSAAQFISNPPRCRSNFNLLVPQTGRRSQSIKSPWLVLEGVKWWWWGGAGQRGGKKVWWHSGKGGGLSLSGVLFITHSISLWPSNSWVKLN